jgi:hypothetical protein
MPELRLQIFRLVEERERAGISEMPTAGQISKTLGVPLRKVVVTLRSSAAMNQVALDIGLNEADEDIPVRLKPPAYIYLEAAMNSQEG